MKIGNRVCDLSQSLYFALFVAVILMRITNFVFMKTTTYFIFRYVLIRSNLPNNIFSTKTGYLDKKRYTIKAINVI